MNRTASLLATAAALITTAMPAHAADAPHAAPAAPALHLQVYNAGPASFHVNAVLVSGAQDAILIDTGFTRADALRIAAMVLDSGKTLRTIYISQADPDFYFGLEVLRTLFPQARVVATAPTVQKIQATLPAKLAFWPSRMGANAPVSVPVPEVMEGRTLSLEGQTLEVRGLDDALPHRSYVWIPSLKAVVGGVNVFAGLHVWTADTPTLADRQAWARQLQGIADLQPVTVVPGHSAPGQAQDLSQVRYTLGYLNAFEQALPQAQNAAALQAAMQKAYPQAGLGIALDIGAKVAKGEMAW